MEEALKRYEQHFGEVYHFFVRVIKSDDEVIEEIDRCIANDARQSEPDYEAGIDY